MKDWKRYENGLHHVGPHWVRFFGDNLIGTAFEQPNPEGRFAWYVADSQQVGAKTFRQGLSSSVQEAKLSADAAVLDRKRGRSAAVEGELTTSTDRNRRRVDRLLASELLARRLIGDLRRYHQELVVTGDIQTADRIAHSLRQAAVGGLSDYIRRTATFRVRSGSRMPSAEEMQADEEAVLKIADELDALAHESPPNIDKFEKTTNELRRLGVFPDSELYSAVVQSFMLKAVT
ncbi:MAG: hypothetical protein OJJ21_20730 [Ferrovibrio sp.]|uniref:hypothetical protein n=1 Tax=Ferrovibrio sp. TaxID=1917215 RepID=UPI002603804F|nr:hypothetical protein [Ferrovibrio sp.]MCW0236035.1 hypothetical protein [Ferrovibrio sp.]